jgi:putative copper export protein/methionine-rich copper-binding protein CopC/mono/diheme cytochrome c family protein
MIGIARQVSSRCGGVQLPHVHINSAQLLVVCAVVFACLGFGTREVAAHAALDSSSPTSGEVVATAPTEISASFTERLDRSYSRLELYDQNGNLVDGAQLVEGADEYTMLLKLPGGLANGTYSVLWRTLSKDDGHSAQNYFAFTIGSDADIVTVTPPSTSLDTGDAPQWAKTLSRWLALIGLAALIALWPVWTFVIRPALSPVWHQAPEAIRRIQRYAVAAVIAAIVGSAVALIVQALTLNDGSILDRIVNTLGQTRYGRLALLRLGLFLFLGLLLSTCAWWFRNRRKVESTLALVASLALPIPFSLIAHAYAQSSGRNVSVLADYFHLLGFGIWFGGLLMLVLILLPIVRGVSPTERRDVLRIALPRFSAIALTSWGVLGLTGFYAGWLHVGNLAALRDTDYGKSLIVKLAFLFVTLILAAINLVIVSKRIASNADAIWHKRLSMLVTAEVVLVLAALIAVGQMTSLQPARDQIVEEAQQINVPFDLDGRNARLLIAPGTTGANHLRLEVSGDSIPTSTEMLLRVTMPGREDLGTREITLSRVAGNAFEHHGSELSISGDWQLTLIERISGAAPNQAETTLNIGTTRPDLDVPGNPWRFETLGGSTALVMFVVGIGGLVLAWFSGKTPMRKESAGLAAVAIAIGVVLLLQARIDPLLANSRGGSAIDTSDVASIQRGEDVYLANCMSCHGVGLRGDGPDATGLQPPPADFMASHAKVHSDADLVYWTKNGKQGTAMPGFAGTLSDQDILDVLTFIKSRQETDTGTTTIPNPSSCTVQPLTMDALKSRIGTATAASPVADPVLAADPTVDSQVQSEVLALTEQFIGCTNGADTMRRLALFSDHQLAASFPSGIDAAFETAASAPPQALPEDQWISMSGTPTISLLADGRIMVNTVVTDPGSNLGQAQSTSMTLIFVQSETGWLIDQIA